MTPVPGGGEMYIKGAYFFQVPSFVSNPPSKNLKITATSLLIKKISTEDA
jgi:hypothetical protein